MFWPILSVVVFTIASIGLSYLAGFSSAHVCELTEYVDAEANRVREGLVGEDAYKVFKRDLAKAKALVPTCLSVSAGFVVAAIMVAAIYLH